MKTEGEKLKQLGLNLVEDHNFDFVAKMRAKAVEICRRNGSVTIDDLRRYSDLTGITPNHQNAWGTVFRGRPFIRSRMKRSTYASNHARMISVWEMED